APTQRRREDARNQGRVAVSSELTTGVILVTGVVALAYAGETLGGGLLATVRHYLLGSTEELDFEQTQSVLTGAMIHGAELLGVFLGMLVVASMAVGVLQVGFRFVPALVSPRWERISPVTGWGRLISLAAVVRGLVACLKVILVAIVAAWILR